MARSGSTLLARELDALKDVAVSIEEDIPDGLVKGQEVKINDEKELEQYLDHIFQDRKLGAWGISKDRLKNVLLRDYGFPLYFNSILEALLDLYFQQDAATHLIHKKGNYYRVIPQVKKLFPDSAIIYLGRDPRAIYNSQQRYRDSTTGVLMSTSILTFCFQ